MKKKVRKVKSVDVQYAMLECARRIIKAGTGNNKIGYILEVLYRGDWRWTAQTYWTWEAAHVAITFWTTKAEVQAVRAHRVILESEAIVGIYCKGAARAKIRKHKNKTRVNTAVKWRKKSSCSV